MSTGSGLFLVRVAAAVLVPTAAVAASTLVTITGPTGIKAAVNPANQLQAAESNPANNLVLYGYTDTQCYPFYTVPAGKALIVKSAQFFVRPPTGGATSTTSYLSAGTCGNKFVAIAVGNT